MFRSTRLLKCGVNSKVAICNYVSDCQIRGVLFSYDSSYFFLFHLINAHLFSWCASLFQIAPSLIHWQAAPVSQAGSASVTNPPVGLFIRQSGHLTIYHLASSWQPRKRKWCSSQRPLSPISPLITKVCYSSRAFALGETPREFDWQAWVVLALAPFKVWLRISLLLQWYLFVTAYSKPATSLPISQSFIDTDLANSSLLLFGQGRLLIKSFTIAHPSKMMQTLSTKWPSLSIEGGDKLQKNYLTDKFQMPAAATVAQVSRRRTCRQRTANYCKTLITMSLSIDSWPG